MRKVTVPKEVQYNYDAIRGGWETEVESNTPSQRQPTSS